MASISSKMVPSKAFLGSHIYRALTKIYREYTLTISSTVFPVRIHLE